MRRRDWVVAGLGGAATGVAIFAVGGALRGPQAVVAVLVAAAAAVQLLSRSRLERTSPLIVLLGLAAGLTAVQLVPLPAAVVAALDPVGAGLRADGAELAGVAAASTLSLDVPGTLRALAFFVTLLGIAGVALRLAVTERGRYAVLAGVALLCGLAATVTGVHTLLHLDKLYGVYQPEHATPAVLGPLLNENQLGQLMALGAVISLGLVMYVRQRAWLRVVWLVNLAACAVATMASHSRGATLALFAGVVVTGGALIGQRIARPPTPQRRRERFMTRSLPIGVVAACTVVVIVYASAGGISRELSRTSLEEVHQPRSKYATWRSAGDLIEETPWVGVGRGAFEPVFTRVHPASAFSTFSHLENEYIQAVVDWGIPGAVALGIAAVWLIVVALRKWRDGPLTAAGLGGVALIALQSNVDFGLELMGIAVPITLVAATLAYVPLREAKGRPLAVSRGVRAGVVVAVLGAAAALTMAATTSLGEDHGALRDRAGLTLADVRPMIERHPLDYYGYALAAQSAIRSTAQGGAKSGDERAVALLNHALTLHPTHPGLHLLAAHLLYSRGRKPQATIEYAAAVRSTGDPTRLITEIVAAFPAELAATAIPLDSHPPGDIVHILEALGHTDVATAWLARVLEVRPDNLRICEMLFDLSLQHGDVHVVDLTAKHCRGFQPSPASQLQLAQVLIQHHQLAEAIAVLHDVDTWAGRADLKVTAWFALCDAYIAQHAWNDAKRCVRRLDVAGVVPATLTGEIAHRLDAIETEIKRGLLAAPAGTAPDKLVKPDSRTPPAKP